MKKINNPGEHNADYQKDTFSCFIIGESTLPIKCAEMIFRRGHKIYGMISNDPNVTKWSEEKSIPCIKVRKSKIFSLLNSHSFDYLFSINGDYVIPEEILALPNELTINYHDSLLPKYAGMYATSWALMNRESMHAVSWHVADRGIDTGDILKQCPVPIEPKDTAFTLNLRCYETALETFEELVNEIVSRQVKRQKQDLNERTYFGYYKRSASGLPAGTVACIDDQSVTVSTLTKDIEIREIYSSDGKKISIDDFIARWHIYEGYKFVEMDRESANRIDAYNSIECLCLCDNTVWKADGIIKSIKEIAARVVENEDIQLMDIRIINDLIYSQSDISRVNLEDFGF